MRAMIFFLAAIIICVLGALVIATDFRSFVIDRELFFIRLITLVIFCLAFLGVGVLIYILRGGR